MTNSLSSDLPATNPPITSSNNHNNTNAQRKKPSNSVESCVTRLLVSTKHLLESLTLWARQEADDKFVSDAYVKLGNDFRAATRAFNNDGMDVSDLGDVPQALRAILETALSEAPSQENLDRFLPNIRNIIVTLLQTLKAKQARLKSLAQERAQVEIKATNSISASQSYVPTKTSTIPTRQEEINRVHSDRQPRNLNHSVEQEQPTARSSLHTKGNHNSNIANNSPASSNNNVNTPQRERFLSPNNHNDQNDALSQLQNGDALQRRASKRFSAYQYAKLTNFSHQNALNNGLPDTSKSNEPIPPIPKTPEISKYRRKSTIQNGDADENTEDETEFYVLLKINEKVKKSIVQKPVTLNAIRLLFVEKFAYSPGSGNFPDIYIQDPYSKHSYELEESLIGEVKKGSLISLNNADTQSKAVTDLNDKLESVLSKMESMSSGIVKNVQDSIAAIEISSFRPAETISPASNIATTTKNESVKNDVINKKELQKLENEIRVLKQMNNSQAASYKKAIQDSLKKLQTLQDIGLETSQDSNRLYMESCHSKLSDESDMLLTKVDDLQDMMEEMRKDVAQRGVRVGEKQLKSIVKEISEARTSLNEMNQFITREKQVWKKIWESELDKVCEEQQFFNLQDDLTNDLQEDLKKIQETYELIEQCSKEQNKNGSFGVGSTKRKNFFLNNIPEPGESLNNVKDAVLIDIQQLNPDHESRVEAIERAEKMRERERQLSRLNQFQEELGDFVEDNKLKKSGGIAELENQRMARDKENLKSSFGII
ncbi:BUD6 [Candida pseudojiufengensis]|uniref:BUD6 n=1 Tax=Candida pseudojiufengensis TaxID=497109 RepID=UPI0022250490|nr:BUD6 [Candida pseudojiufengensis]KAI5960215.1 BUD6 [Candida pseudojiufengensis]